ncbi:hypothetical protein BC826DRAFT_1046186 [Russula brevipes]|nr:hypothetical protein BC826DRAFT_1046186 [Russula brevipes]
MLSILPVELSLAVLAYLPIPSLYSLLILSRQWSHFFSVNQSRIFRNAGILHGYAKPGTLLLEEALSLYTPGSPWEGATDWKDFCRRCCQLRRNWEGKGRVVARLVTPPGGDVHRIKVDEKAGICITTHMFGGLSVTHLFSGILYGVSPALRPRYAHCEYENGYLVFNRNDNQQEIWRLASDGGDDFAAGEVATHSPPGEEQRRASASAATTHRQYAPRGHSGLAYPTLLCASQNRAFLHDVRTGALVQTIDVHLRSVCSVDVNERHVLICERRRLRVLRIPSVAFVRQVASPALVQGNPFVASLPLLPGSDNLRPDFLAAHVSRNGRDLVILTASSRLLLFRDFERVCRCGQVLRLLPHDVCFYLAFEHERICVATVPPWTLHFTIDEGPSIDSVKAAFVRPFLNPAAPVTRHGISCAQLTDRRVYFTWEDSRRRDVPLFRDEADAPGPSSLGTPSIIQQLGQPWVGLGFGTHETLSMREKPDEMF